MGRSPSRSRQTNASPWSTKTERQRPPVNAHMNDTGAATSSGTPRASTAVFVRDRQNAFHRTSSSRLQPTGGRGASLARVRTEPRRGTNAPSVKTTHVAAATTASSSAGATTTSASGLSSWSRGRHTASRGDPTSASPTKKLAPTSATAAGFGS